MAILFVLSLKWHWERDIFLVLIFCEGAVNIG